MVMDFFYVKDSKNNKTIRANGAPFKMQDPFCYLNKEQPM